MKAVNPALGASFVPVQTARATRRADAIVFAAGDFGSDIEGRLVWFGLRGALRLAWAFTVTDQDAVSRYSVVVEDSSGAILDKTELTLFATPPIGTSVRSKAHRSPILRRESVLPAPRLWWIV